jgi:hypothetical protein
MSDIGGRLRRAFLYGVVIVLALLVFLDKDASSWRRILAMSVVMLNVILLVIDNRWAFRKRKMD